MTRHNAPPIGVTELPQPLPRLMRPLPAGAMPGVDLLALYDPKQNLVIYNKDLFDQLTAAGQRATLRTHRTLLISDMADELVPDVVDLRHVF